MAPLVVLVGAVVLTPWAFGGVTPGVEWAVVLVMLGTVALSALRGSPSNVPLPLGLAAGVLGVAAFQLLPLPPALHALAAPASAQVWHPADPTVAAVLGTVWRPISVHPDSTLRSLAFGFGLLGLVAFALPALRHRRVLLGTALTLVGSGVAVASLGVIGRLLFDNRLYGTIPVPTVSPFGPFVSKNHFAGYVELTALLALGLAFGFLDEARRGGRALDWMDSPGAWKPLTALGSALALGLAVLLSQSRGGVVSLSMGALALPLLRTHVRGRRLTRGRLGLLTALAAALVASTLMVLPADTRDRLATLARGPSDLSASYRLGVWRDAVHGVGGSPLLGFGLGTFEHALPPFKTSAGELRVEHAENEYVELLLETGGTGLLLNLAALAVLALSVVRGLRSQEERLVRGVGLGAVAGLTALAVHSLGDFNLRIPSNALLAATLVALAVGASRGAPCETTAPVLRGASLVIPVCLFACLLMAGVRRSGRPHVSARATSILRSQAYDADLVRDLQHAPTDAYRWLALAWSRGMRQRPEAAALARHGARCDPASQRTGAEADRLEAAFREGREGLR